MEQNVIKHIYLPGCSAEGYYNHIFLNLHKSKQAEAEVVPRSSLVKFSLVKLS